METKEEQIKKYVQWVMDKPEVKEEIKLRIFKYLDTGQ